MRNKFSEWIDSGIASFDYENIIKDTPEQDLICRTYNNIYSIPSDTHMSMLEDGTRIITGHMINTPKWAMFMCSNQWGSVNFADSGCWSVCSFLCCNGLKGEKCFLNGDWVYVLSDINEEDCKCCDCCPSMCHTNESKIPQPISILSKDGNKIRVEECFKGNIKEVTNNLNESAWIKGDNWVTDGDKIFGLINNKTYIIY